MKSVYALNKENKKEAIKLLKTIPDNKIVFNSETGYPYVIFADNDGNLEEYKVEEIELHFDYDIDIKLGNDYNDEKLDMPISWLYGASECYIYEYLIDYKHDLEETLNIKL